MSQLGGKQPDASRTVPVCDDSEQIVDIPHQEINTRSLTPPHLPVEVIAMVIEHYIHSSHVPPMQLLVLSKNVQVDMGINSLVRLWNKRFSNFFRLRKVILHRDSRGDGLASVSLSKPNFQPTKCKHLSFAPTIQIFKYYRSVDYKYSVTSLRVFPCESCQNGVACCNHVNHFTMYSTVEFSHLPQGLKETSYSLNLLHTEMLEGRPSPALSVRSLKESRAYDYPTTIELPIHFFT